MAVAKNATSRKAEPAKKAAAPRRPVRVSKDAQERVVRWAVNYAAPVQMLTGWDPDTGMWDPSSPIGLMLADMAEHGVHLHTAARKHDVRRVGELVARGRQFMADGETSEDRALVPVDVRPFIDLALLVDAVETEVERSVVSRLYSEARTDSKVGTQFLSRRFPQRWRDQQEVHNVVEYDPYDAAVSQLLEDPNTVASLAAFARRAEQLAAEARLEEI